MTDPLYIVWGPSGSTNPRVTFSTPENAQLAAEVMCRKHDETFYVMKACGKAVPVREVKAEWVPVTEETPRRNCSGPEIGRDCDGTPLYDGDYAMCVAGSDMYSSAAFPKTGTAYKLARDNSSSDSVAVYRDSYTSPDAGYWPHRFRKIKPGTIVTVPAGSDLQF